MADGNTTATTEAPSEGAGDKGASKARDDRGSEFAGPTGAKDAEIWDKHFGKGGKEKAPKRTEPSAERSKKTSTESSGKRSEKSSSKPSEASDKTSSKSSDAERADSSSRKGGKDSSANETKSSRDTSSDREKETESAEETDPEAPSKKARDLYAAAKKAEDPKEARRLYKRAMKEAFGELPDEFDDGRYAAIRMERKAAVAALEAKAAEKDGKIREAAEKLKPAIYVMRQLEGAGIEAGKLTVPLVEKAVTVLRALRDLEGGDYTTLASVISKATGVDPDEAMKRFVRGVKISPESRAARAAADAAQARAAAAERRIQELEKRLTERDTAQNAAAQKVEHERRVTAARASYLENIESELEGHPVLKLPNGSKRVMSYIIKTADKKLKSARYTFAQAADRIVRYERARVAAARDVLDTDGEELEAAPARESSSRVVHIPRSARAEAGTADTSPEATFNRIFDKHHGTGGRRR